MQTSSPAKHWTDLDGVRGLAALLVIYAHLFLIWVPAKPSAVFWLRTLTGEAWTGVYLFFLLSGFLIGGILLKNRESKNYFSVFYARRALRIFPPYFLLIGIFYLLRAFLFSRFPAEFEPQHVPLWSYFVFTQNVPMARTGDWGAPYLAVSWSVALEEQFYLFLPVWIKLIPRRWVLGSFLVLAAIGPIFRTVSGLAYAPFLVPGSAEALFLGACIAWLHLERPAVFKSTKWRAGAVSLMMIGGMGMLAIVTRHSLGALDISLITIFWGAFLWLVIANLGGRVTAPLRHRSLVSVGSISYSLYLFHPVINSLVFLIATHGPPSHAVSSSKGFPLAVLSFCLSLGFAAFLYFALEKRFISMGRKMKYARTPTELVDKEATPLAV